jgi:hypothetical protein
MTFEINYDRPLIKGIGAIDETVIMYLDVPGEYFDQHGQPVGEDAAIRVGFPVDDHRASRRKLEQQHRIAAEVQRMADAQKQAVEDVLTPKEALKAKAKAILAKITAPKPVASSRAQEEKFREWKMIESTK